MTSADWAILVPVIVTFLTAATGWLKSHQAQKTAIRAEAKADNAEIKADKALNGN